MSSSQSSIKEFWERCIAETMFLRGHCRQQPYLYYTESGSLVLDARPVSPADRDVIDAIFVTCDIVAGLFGFYEDVSSPDDGLHVWKKGGDA